MKKGDLPNYEVTEFLVVGFIGLDGLPQFGVESVEGDLLLLTAVLTLFGHILRLTQLQQE